jgi:hypothetical protein
MARDDLDIRYPTTLMTRFADGRCLSTDRAQSMWLYRAVPLGPIKDAASPQDAVDMMEPINSIASRLAEMAPVVLNRRNASKGNYRQFHALLINVPRYFDPGFDNPLRPFLINNFGDHSVDYRLLLFGVKLKASAKHQGAHLKEMLDSVAFSLRYGTIPLSDYDDDYHLVDQAMTASGFTIASDLDFQVANAWWSSSSNPELPLLVHPDHLHVFPSIDRARIANKYMNLDCGDWPSIEGAYKLSFGTVYGFDLPLTEASDPTLLWSYELLARQAVVISLRGSVEPPAVTRYELRRKRGQFIGDIEDQMSANKMDRDEQTELLGQLEAAEADYATKQGYPVFHATTITVGVVGDLNTDELSRIGVTIFPMQNRQEKALLDTMLCSSVRANPYKHDLPSSFLAASGLSSLSIVGDQYGAMVGFTEQDQQTAYISPTAAADQDQLPLVLTVGQTGSGKSLLMLWLAAQFAQISTRTHTGQSIKTPVVIIDPKPMSDHSSIVSAFGGTIYSLDSILESDGPLDPLRFSGDPAASLNTASLILLTVNPWGSRALDMETPLAHALSYGVKNGARCIGDALRVALRDNQASHELVDPVLRLAESSPMFHACVGLDSTKQALSVSEGITLIKVGNTALNLPDPSQPKSEYNQPQRIAMSLIQMMVFGSANAVARRNGVVMLDEAWTFLGAGRDQIESLGRLARSQGVLPMLFTQKVTDAVNAGLSGFISRGFIMPIRDQAEAIAACELFKLEPTPERIARITANDTLNASSASITGAPNWESMRALRDPRTGQVLRGTIAIYYDLAGRAVPVEVALPAEFLRLSSTRPDDVLQRTMAG